MIKACGKDTEQNLQQNSYCIDSTAITATAICGVVFTTDGKGIAAVASTVPFTLIRGPISSLLINSRNDRVADVSRFIVFLHTGGKTAAKWGCLPAIHVLKYVMDKNTKYTLV